MNDREIEWAQRIAVLELKVQQLNEQSEEIKSKLDELLQLRSKGVGAFWLASTLLGTGIVGVIFALFNWMKGSL